MQLLGPETVNRIYKENINKHSFQCKMFVSQCWYMAHKNKFLKYRYAHSKHLKTFTCETITVSQLQTIS